MDEISMVISQFSSRLLEAIDAEVKRQVGALIAVQPLPVVEVKQRRVYAKATPKPCPTCGLLNTARRYRHYCAEHRS